MTVPAKINQSYGNIKIAYLVQICSVIIHYTVYTNNKMLTTNPEFNGHSHDTYRYVIVISRYEDDIVVIT